MAKITVIGSFVMDTVAKMDRFPNPGETVSGNSISCHMGGKGLNQCISVARLGGDVEMCGMLGNDENGNLFKRLLKEEGVEHSHVFTCNKPTAVAQIQINREGQNRICVIPSANYEFSFSEVEAIDEVLKNTELVILQLEIPVAIVEEIIQRCQKYGKKVILNPAPAVAVNREILRMVDYLTPNENELSVLTGMSTSSVEEIAAASQKLYHETGATIVVTLGEKGAMVCDSEGCRRIGGYKVKAVDTVGAGDSFNGALAVALTEGKNLEQCVRFANAMGALTVTKDGAVPSLHTRAELERFMDDCINEC